MSEVTRDRVYAEVKRLRKQLKSIEKTLDNLALLLMPEEKVSPEEMEELKTLKEEALRGECVSLEEVKAK